MRHKLMTVVFSIITCIICAFAQRAAGQDDTAPPSETEPAPLRPPTPTIPLGPSGQGDTAVRKVDALVEQAQSQIQNAEANAAKSQQLANAQATIDLAKSGKLMSSGITLGTAVALQAPLRWGQHIQRSADVVAMPYLMALPGYWGASQPVREYCASSWGVGDDAEASQAASAAARKVARQKVAAIAADLRVGQRVEDAVFAWFEDGWEFSNDEQKKRHLDYANVIVAIVKRANELEASAPAVATTLRESAVDSLTAREWDPTARGRCWYRSIGIWVGRPLKYTVATRIGDEKANSDRQVKPVIAFGIGYTPHAYLSTLLGFTLANVDQQQGNTRSLWTVTAALGGNLDLLGALFK